MYHDAYNVTCTISLVFSFIRVITTHKIFQSSNMRKSYIKKWMILRDDFRARNPARNRFS